MIIPHEMLSLEALHGVIEAFVTREGTDYGTQDVSLATKVVQVRQQLDAGSAPPTGLYPLMQRRSACTFRLISVLYAGIHYHWC